MNWAKWETNQTNKEKFITHRLVMTHHLYEKETWSFTLVKTDPRNVMCCHFFKDKCINTIELTVENARKQWDRLVNMGAILDVE
jgi:uncharacterized protein YdeI (YjbR/CyaY-like superfamily)